MNTISLTPVSQLSERNQFIIHMRILAPSANNRQPIRVIAKEGCLDFYQEKKAHIDTVFFIAHCCKVLYENIRNGELTDIIVHSSTENELIYQTCEFVAEL